MSATKRRLISFAGSTVAIDYRGARPAAIVEFLFKHAPGAGDKPPNASYRLTLPKRSNHLFLYRNKELFYKNSSDAAVAEILLGECCHHLAKDGRGGLLFHAAALAWKDQGILIPGSIGAGKTTLAAWLLAKGLNYLTDELVFVPKLSTEMQAFTRPLNVKRPSLPALDPYLDTEKQAGSILCNAHSCLVPHNLIGPAEPLAQAPINLILFPHYYPTTQPVIRPLSGAQAGLALMQCLVNARNLPEHGFKEIAQLAQLAPSFHLEYSGFEQLENWLDKLLQQSF